MTTTSTVTSHFDIGRVISRTFGAIGKNLPTFLVLTLLLFAVPQFLTQWGMAYANETQITSGGLGRALAAGPFMFVGWLISFVLAYVLQACLVHGTVQFLRGRSASLGAAFSTGLSVFLPLIGLSILMTLGEFVGFIALVVPGLMLMVRWSVAVPTLVIERERGVFGSMGRSAELTRGHRWSIFALFVIFAIVLWLVSSLGMAVGLGAGGAAGLASGSPEGMVGAMHNPVFFGVQAVLGSLTTLVGAVGVASLYYELRSLKENIGASDLAAIFD